MKKGKSKKKGGAFERMICKKLSLWWTKGKREDVFIRTASSGGMAAQRAKKNKQTFGQHGDIQAADPVGQPLIDLCVIECKDGYASNSIADLFDREPRHNPLYEQFIRQARLSYLHSNSAYWMLIARRRGRQIMVFMPAQLFRNLYLYYNSPNIPTLVKLRTCLKGSKLRMDIIGLQLDCFLKNVKIRDIKFLAIKGY